MDWGVGEEDDDVYQVPVAPQPGGMKRSGTDGAIVGEQGVFNGTDGAIVGEQGVFSGTDGAIVGEQGGLSQLLLPTQTYSIASTPLSTDTAAQAQAQAQPLNKLQNPSLATRSTSGPQLPDMVRKRPVSQFIDTRKAQPLSDALKPRPPAPPPYIINSQAATTTDPAPPPPPRTVSKTVEALPGCVMSHQ